MNVKGIIVLSLVSIQTGLIAGPTTVSPTSKNQKPGVENLSLNTSQADDSSDDNNSTNNSSGKFFNAGMAGGTLIGGAVMGTTIGLLQHNKYKKLEKTAESQKETDEHELKLRTKNLENERNAKMALNEQMNDHFNRLYGEKIKTLEEEISKKTEEFLEFRKYIESVEERKPTIQFIPEKDYDLIKNLKNIQHELDNSYTAYDYKSVVDFDKKQQICEKTIIMYEDTLASYNKWVDHFNIDLKRKIEVASTLAEIGEEGEFKNLIEKYRNLSSSKGFKKINEIIKRDQGFAEKNREEIQLLEKARKDFEEEQDRFFDELTTLHKEDLTKENFKEEIRKKIRGTKEKFSNLYDQFDEKRFILKISVPEKKLSNSNSKSNISRPDQVRAQNQGNSAEVKIQQKRQEVKEVGKIPEHIPTEDHPLKEHTEHAEYYAGRKEHSMPHESHSAHL